ncbi:unnamed protein product [Arctia plantaginis]|uniref:Uncharacterized protein n=1 Tax=Arctia plantaginis TaxID=874455 RepID=A0A8S0Z3W5_ARCPL|nr:unnamed protein product [Arctia plantaginis]
MYYVISYYSVDPVRTAAPPHSAPATVARSLCSIWWCCNAPAAATSAPACGLRTDSLLPVQASMVDESQLKHIIPP